MKANLLMISAALISILLCILCLLIFKILQKRIQRRSPLDGRQVGHVPGQQLVARVENSQDDMMMSVMCMFLSFPLMLQAWAISNLSPNQFQFDKSDFVFILGALLMFGFGLRSFIKNWRIRQNAKDGLLAERVTGMQLNRLVAQNCIVMHDLPCENFNIDHVVISPRGVYAVETKSFRKPKNAIDEKHYNVVFDGNTLRFPDFVEKSAVAQAERQALWLSKLLKESLALDIHVTPALALPGWHVQQTDDVWRSSKTKVFTPMGSGANFMAKELNRIDLSQRSLISKALAIRYPNITD